MTRKERRHNPVAKALRTTRFRKRVVRSRKVYDRKRKPTEKDHEGSSF
jgi:hypothetical protein